MLLQDAGTDLPLLAQGAVALGLGLFIGLEREHRHVDEKDRDEAVLGVRTFALFGLTGWLAALLAEQALWMSGLLLGLTGVLVVAKYLRETQGGRHLGITTEVAALLTLVYGFLTHHETRLAVTLALVTAVILISKPWVRVVVPKLLRSELLAALQFLIVVAIVLPLLPEEPLDPWGVLPPRAIGEFVVLVAGVGFVGYVLTRLMGTRRAAALTGLLGGLVSSTAVTMNMAQRARREGSAAAAAELTTLAANTVMGLRVLVIAFVVAPTVAVHLLAPLGGFTVLMVLGTLRAARANRSARTKAPSDDDPLVRNPFALLPAIQWGALLCGVLVLAHLLQRWLGDAGLLVTGAVAGLTDVDAVTLASTRQAEAGSLPASTAQLAILLAVFSNTVVKIVLARVGGGPAFGRRVGLVLGASAALAVVLALVF